MDDSLEETYRGGLHAVMIRKNMLNQFNEFVGAIEGDESSSNQNFEAMSARIECERYPCFPLSTSAALHL
jgi:hypothetical protein